MAVTLVSARRRFRPLPFVILETDRKELAMANYLLAYRGGSMPETDTGRAANMAAWGAFIGGFGDATVDAGNPFGAASTIDPSGAVTEGAASALHGYSIIAADDLAAATERAKGCPALAQGGSVEVHEIVPVM